MKRASYRAAIMWIAKEVGKSMPFGQMRDQAVTRPVAELFDKTAHEVATDVLMKGAMQIAEEQVSKNRGQP